MGARREPVPAPPSTSSPASSRSRARSWRATRSARSSPERVAFLDLSPETSRGPSPATGRSSSAATDRSGGRPRSGASTLSNRTGPALDPCGAVRVEVELGPARTTVVIGLLGDAVDAAQVARARRAVPRPGRGRQGARTTCATFWDGVLGTIGRAHARSVDGPAAQSLAALPDARRAGSGGARRSISPAARSASATSCRTRWR